MLPGRHRATAPGRTLDSCSQKFLPAATASITNYNASATTAATTIASAAAVASGPVFIASDADYDDPAKNQLLLLLLLLLLLPLLCRCLC